MKKSDKFLKIVEWSENDKCYVGSAPGFIGTCCHGDNEIAVYEQLCTIIEEWDGICQKDKLQQLETVLDKTFSGNFVLRINKDLHKALTIRAIKSGESLNSMCTALLQNEFTGEKS